MTLAPFVLQVDTGPLLLVIVAAAALYAVFLLVPVFGLAVLFDVYRTNRRIADSMEAVETHLETLGENVAAVESTLDTPEPTATLEPDAERTGKAESSAEEETESDTSEGGTTASADEEAETDSSGGEAANGSDSDEADDAGESTE